MCMCITYHISFVCGLTNNQVRKKGSITINVHSTFQPNLPYWRLPLFKANIARMSRSVNTKSKPATLELCRTATILVRSLIDFKSAVCRALFGAESTFETHFPSVLFKRQASTGRTWTAAFH